MTCPRRGCAQPLTLDASHEENAVRYNLPTRRWFCSMGHTLWEPVARAKSAERPVLDLSMPGRCSICNKELRRDSTGRAHQHCREQKARRAFLSRMKKAKALIPRKPCRTCERVFQPTTLRNIDCEQCRRFRNCSTCGKRHYPDGRHVVGRSLKWATTRTSAHKRIIAAAVRRAKV